MPIRFTKQLRIALDGINVVTYKVGDVVDEPHKDLADFTEYYETLEDPNAEPAEVDEVVIEDEGTKDERVVIVKKKKARRW